MQWCVQLPDHSEKSYTDIIDTTEIIEVIEIVVLLLFMMEMESKIIHDISFKKLGPTICFSLLIKLINTC